MLSISSRTLVSITHVAQEVSLHLPSKQPSWRGTTTSGGNALGTLPRLRSYTSLDWTDDRFAAGLANNFISHVSDIGTGGFTYYTNFAANPTAFARCCTLRA